MVKLKNEQNERIKHLVHEYMKKGKLPGLSLAVVKGNETIFEKSFGYADREAKKRVTNHTLFEIASNSKAFTALTILDLENRGSINRKEDIRNYIPWFHMKYNGKDALITLEDLMHHTSGIPFSSVKDLMIYSGVDALYNGVKQLSGVTLIFKPGERRHYSSMNYNILGFVVEIVTGLSYEQYLQENILDVLGLSHTYLYREVAEQYDMAEGYKISYLKARRYKAPFYGGNKPSAYIISDIHDMANWVKVQLGFRGNASIRELVKKSHVYENKLNQKKKGSFYGGGWIISDEEQSKIYHAGSNPNFSSYVLLLPKLELGIVALSNLNSDYVEQLVHDISNLLQGEAYGSSIKDVNQAADKVAMVFMLILIIGIMPVLDNIPRHNSVLFFILGLCCLLAVLPRLFYSGVNWRYAFEWMPHSLRAMVYLLYACLGSTFIASMLSK
jgi:CubicO group peptidase (beta-lactamase class C family)